MAESKSKYIEPDNPLDYLLSFTDTFREGGLMDKVLGFLDKTIGKPGGDEKLLKLLDGIFGVPELIAKGLIRAPSLLAYPAFAVELIKGRLSGVLENRKKTQAEKLALVEKEVLAARVEEEQKLLTEAYHRSEGKINQLLDSQKRILQQAFKLEDGADKELLTSINLISWLDIDEDKINKPSLILEDLDNRRKTQSIIRTLLQGTAISGNDEEKIRKVYSYLSNFDPQNQTLTTQEQQFIDTTLNLPELSVDSFMEDLVMEELIRIGFNITSGSTLETELNKTDQIINFFERFKTTDEKGDNPVSTLDEIVDETLDKQDNLNRLSGFLKKYKDTLFTGAALSTVKVNNSLSGSELMPEDLRTNFNNLGTAGINPFLNLGFVTIPTQDQIQSKLDRYNSLINNFPSEEQFKTTYERFYSKYPDKSQISKNLDVLQGLSKKQVEALDSLSTLFIKLSNANIDPITVSFQGTSVDIPRGYRVVISLINALGAKDFSGAQEGEVEYNPEAIQHLLTQISNVPELKPLRDLLEELNNIPFLKTDLIFGNEEIGYSNSLINFIKNLNYPEYIFKYLFIASDGDFPALDKQSLNESISQRVSIMSALNVKAWMAENLLQASSENGARFNNLASAHNEQLKRIASGDMVIKRNIENGRDHQGYIAELERLNKDLIFNMNMKDGKERYPELAELTYAFELKRNMVRVDYLNNEKDTEKLLKGLSNLARILYARFNQLIETQGGKESHDKNFIDEILFIEHYMSILNALGFDPLRVGNEININTKLLKMYLNGYDISRTSQESSSFDGNIGEGDFTLSLGTNKLNIAA